MKGPFPLVFSRTSCPASSSVWAIWASGYQKAQVPAGRCRSVISSSSALFTASDSCSSVRRSDSPFASSSAEEREGHYGMSGLRNRKPAEPSELTRGAFTDLLGCGTLLLHQPFTKGAYLRTR
ncbi:hypothetical protein EYF80_045826 [Liparis tanakae]|uniref:Uncharacterized protein n=1 Tax=Liparis tanakae TaxID=230148 RepID=A0A4Z2FSI8_9TELE|nr:hypothetical protein EYF80_045826 [Liparis tanakae]